jgi:hypothetical protein
MKYSSLLTLAALAAFTAAAAADTITTLRGKTFRDCKIAQVHPDGISFTHRSGAAKILFTDLPASLRSKYGYDRKKADAYAKKIVEARKEREKRTQKYLAREQEAIEAANFVNTMRTMQAQTQMMLDQSGGYPNYGPAIFNGVAVNLTLSSGWTGDLYAYLVNDTGFMAATCMATSLAAASSPSNSTTTPMRVPCR